MKVTVIRGGTKRRRGAVISVVTALASMLVVGTFTGVAHAATGTATAQAASVNLLGSTTVGPLSLGLGLGGSTPQASAPATDGTANAGADLNLSALLANAGVDVVTTSATRAGTTTSAESHVASVGVNAFGTSVLSSGDITSQVSCPGGGTTTAATTPVNVKIGNTTVNAVAGATLDVPVNVVGLVGADVTVAVSSPHSTTATTASATGLEADLTLTASTILGVGVTLPLGSVKIAITNCASPNAVGPPPAGPTITGIVPTSGPTYGGQTVTITGTDFVTGQTDVSFGGLPASAVNVVGPTSLTATTPIASAAGPVNVTVTTPDGTSGPLGYTYVGPVITAITPDQGPTAGGQSVTITGSGFAPNADVTIGGNAAVGVAVNPAGTSITATTPAGAAGPADVVVIQPGPDALLANGYTYVAPGAPTIEGIDPDHGPTAGGQTVTITGTGFVSNATTVAFDGTQGTQVTVNSSVSLTVVTPAHAVGGVDVLVSNAVGDSGTRAYTYLAPGSTPTPDPTPTSLNPNAAVSATDSSLPFTGFDLLVVCAFGVLLLAAGAWCAVVRNRGSLHL